MSKINVLSSETINKIAAGEVVERPASVVKELVENSIDAGASSISIEIQSGGISLIRITDNGCGIAREDVENAFLRHATSKISTADDLYSIESLGFRGEALASISAVAKVEMITKTADELVGTRTTVDGGISSRLDDIGCPTGTTIIVKDLFYNVPARKKFLKAPATEGERINAMLERLALSHPCVSFKFIDNGRTSFFTSGTGKVRDVIYSIYGREIAANLIEIDYSDELTHVTGYIGKPSILRSNRKLENFFVNGRYFSSKIISDAIEEAYRPYAMLHRYPFTALNIEVDTARVDVNVHPSKLEVRFDNERFIYNSMLACCAEGLSFKDLISYDAVPKTISKPSSAGINKTQDFVITAPHKPEVKKEELKIEPPEPFLVNKTIEYRQQSLFETSEIKEEKKIIETAIEENSESRSLNEEFDGYRVIGQIFDTYWLIEAKDKVFMIDQHAAHEKVLYEKFMKRVNEKSVMSQTLLPPIVLTLTKEEQHVVAVYKEDLMASGYEINDFGGSECIINAVPYELYGMDVKDYFYELVSELSDVKAGKLSEGILSFIASASCKAAIKGNTRITEAEAKALIESLVKLENPYFCPHGRPIIINLKKYEVEKMFKRIV